jgi:phospholipase C
MLRNITYSTAGRVILATAAPVQRLLQRHSQTHDFCNLQAGHILDNDGYGDYAHILNKFLNHLNGGVKWADEGLRNTAHFYQPDLRKGLAGCRDARLECEYHWQKALKSWRIGKYERAFFYLGAAVHLVQDLCVPHHAKGILLDGHQEYEDWAEANSYKYRVWDEGIYYFGQHRFEWIQSNAELADGFMYLVSSGASQKDYNQATLVLLPQAQRTTAGFIAYFLKNVGM